MPTTEEIDFTLEILEQVATPALDTVENLLKTTSKWDSISRNDFCRYALYSYHHRARSLTSNAIRSLHTCRAIWGGLSTFYQELPKEVANPCLNDADIPELIVSFIDVKAGFTLTDPNDRRYQKAVAHKKRYGEVCQRAAAALRQNTEGEDHIDAVLGVARAIDTFMLGYALNRGDFDSLQKNYTQARE